MITDATIAGRFNGKLGRQYATLLIGGASEPLYLPARGRQPAMIRYTHDYSRSALHELAHWAIAGRRRLDLVDYGYWYIASPRNAVAQAAFFHAELRVQALESVFCGICNLDFEVSADNIGTDSGDFAGRVATLAGSWQRRGLEGRAARIAQMLAA